MKPAGNKMDAGVDLRRSIHDLVDAGMRARDHDDHTVGRIERERQFTQFERTRLVGDQCDQMGCRVAISTFLSTSWKLATGRAAPNRITSGGTPS